MEAGEKRILWLPGAPEAARRACAFARDAAAGHFTPAECALLEVAVSEAFTNIVEHGYGRREGNHVCLVVIHEGDRISFTFEDCAPHPFRLPPEAKEPEAATLSPRGRGLFLIRQAVHELSSLREGRWNRLRLARRLAQPETMPPHEPLRARCPAESRLHEELEERIADGRRMAEDLSHTHQALDTIYSFSRDIVALSGENELLDKILRRITGAAGAAWGVLRLRDGKNLHRRAMAGAPPECPLDVPLHDETLPEPRAFASFTEQQSHQPGGGHALAVPLLGMDQPLGTLLLGSPKFHSSQVRLARALADQAAITIENFFMTREVLNTRLDRCELEIAHDLQQRLYPTNLPGIPGLRLFAEGVAARQVGGDYLAVLPGPEGTLDFILADAMGKGMPAAFFSILTHIAFRGVRQLMADSSPGRILTTFNRLMGDDFERFDMFMTALVGRINPAARTLAWASAGHCIPLLAEPGAPPRFLEPLDFMLGVNPDMVFREKTVAFRPGAKLLAYTDGFTDIATADGNIRGADAFRADAARRLHLPIAEACRQLVDEAVGRFREGGLQDDLALIGVEFLPKTGAETAPA